MKFRRLDHTTGCRTNLRFGSLTKENRHQWLITKMKIPFSNVFPWSVTSFIRLWSQWPKWQRKNYLLIEFDETGGDVLSPSELEVVSIRNRPLWFVLRPFFFEPDWVFFLRPVLTAFGFPISAIIDAKLLSASRGCAKACRTFNCSRTTERNNSIVRIKRRSVSALFQVKEQNESYRTRITLSHC